MRALRRVLRRTPGEVSIIPALLAIVAPARGQPAPSAVSERARVEAIRAVRSPTLDGRLDDPAWQQARFMGGFVQREPQEGQPATQPTEVAFLYTEDALYVGARLREAPGLVRALVTRRDREETSDQLVVSLDSYRDYRTAYTFAVTAAGVRIDYYHSADFENARNYSYDPVWEAETQVDSLGWTAEIRIPFSQLRFNASDPQVWGVNLARITPARNEAAYWQLVKRNETGWSSRMGELAGLRGVRPTRRAELLPYVASDVRSISNIDSNNPFAEARQANWRAGVDLKLGMGPDFTLDATFNPDFGQVEADPAEVNLSAFETFFNERRPFFLEGTQLLAARGNFYSRRIGAPPLIPNAQYSEAIDHTSILGATKITGRTRGGLSVAALTALTASERARTFNAPGSFGEIEVAPTTGYAVVALQQEFGNPSQTSSVGFLELTHVERDLEPGSFLANALAQRAMTGIADYRVRWRGGQYDMSVFFGWSYLQGDTTAMLAQKLSSRRYYQRPDADYVDLDPGARSLFGTFVGINHSKLSGKHWLWDIDLYQEAPGFELNDVGRLGGSDDRGLSANLRYRETTPSRWYRSYEFAASGYSEWNFGNVRQFRGISASAGAQLANYWQGNVSTDAGFRSLNDALTRGGPLMGTAQYVGLSGNLSNRPGSRTRWRLSAGGNRDELDGWGAQANVSLGARPGTQWEIAFDPRISRNVNMRQYLFSTSGGRAETFGRRYVFSGVERSELAARIRINYALTPDFTLETYAEPFASSGRFFNFGELSAARSMDLRNYGSNGTTTISQPDSVGRHTVQEGSATFTIPNNDFNVRSFRSNVVARWEWRPGSTLFLVWQQNRGSRAPVGNLVNVGDVFDGLSASGNNFFALKMNYWLPIR